MKSKNYWNNKIIEWENSIGKTGNVSFIELLASYFRKPLKVRSEICIKILKPFVKYKAVLELGCGSGFFAFKLFDLCKPKHIYGVDIAKNAIKRAQEICKDRNLTNKFTFSEGDVISTRLIKSDITIGLGLLDYLTPEEIRALFKNIKSKYFLFTFAEKKFSLLRYLHIIYLWSQKCPKHFYYTQTEITNCIGDNYGKLHFLRNKKLSFGCIVHNLPVP